MHLNILGLVYGIILGSARFITEYVYEAPACHEEDLRPLFARMNFMYFGKTLGNSWKIFNVYFELHLTFFVKVLFSFSHLSSSLLLQAT